MSYVLVEREGPAVHLRLTRGERGNAIDMALATELEAGVQQVTGLAEAADVCCVVLRTDGRNFCVGGDLRDFPADPDEVTPHLERMAAQVHRALAALWALPVPVVVRLQGAAAGAGVGLALAGDLVVAGRSARLALAYTAVGLSPDNGVSWLLPRVVGARRALDLVLTGRTLSAEQGEDWGLVSRVAEDDALDDAVAAVVADLATRSPAALRASKRLLRQAAGADLVDQLADEATSIAALAAGPDAVQAREGFFAQRR